MRPVHIDTDVALGAASGDVDDAYALAAILRGPAVQLLKVTTVFGNTSSARAAECARNLIALTGKRVEVIPGADAAGKVSTAAEAIADLPPGTQLLALGPLTNIAAALKRDPTVSQRITISLVGGNLSSWGRWPPFWPFEFNLAKDPEAARIVFNSPTPRRIYPLDVCCDLTVGPIFLRRLAQGDPLSQALAAGSWRWLARAPLRYGTFGFPLWDLVPALDLLHMLPHAEEKRRLRCEGRGLLVDDGGAEQATCIRGIDPKPALEAFERLLH
jgi:inosine-uridine nucleoside N-ribohydrolase